MPKHAFVYERNRPKDQDRELTIAQAASRLGISTQSVYRLKDSGELVAVRKGPKKGYVVLESEVERFRQSRADEAAVADPPELAGLKGR